MLDLHWHRYDDETTTGWKTYPVRVRGPSLSSCCQVQTLLVHSKKAGYVTANCSKCGTPENLTRAEFFSLDLWVGCPSCRGRMVQDMVPDAPGRARNYCYVCEACRCCVKLASLLPHWADVVPAYFGPTVEEIDAEYLPRLWGLVELMPGAASYSVKEEFAEEFFALKAEHEAARRAAMRGRQ
jgi:hypothetical protein